MSSAFVTGGSGFIGGALVRRLVGDGWRVRALARSDEAATAVEQAGAEPVRGDLADARALRSAAGGCELAFHTAATVAQWGPREEFFRTNVEGTRRVLEASAAAGVRRLVHVGTEAALLAGQPLVNADETVPLRPDSKAPYAATKALAEREVRGFEDVETVVVRPRFVWGPGDTSVLPSIVATVERGRFSWIGGGRHRTSTTYIDNVVHGLLLGAEKGKNGEAYFITDGEPVVFRDFVTRLLATRGVKAPDRNTPAALARAAAPVAEGLWRLFRLRGEPPVTRLAVWVSSLECTIDISKAQAELGYEPVASVEDGLAALAG